MSTQIFAVGLGQSFQGITQFTKSFTENESNSSAVQDFVRIVSEKLDYSGGNATISLKGVDLDDLRETFEQNNHAGTVSYLDEVSDMDGYTGFDPVIVIMENGTLTEGSSEESYLILDLFTNGVFNALVEEERSALVQIFGGLPTIPMEIDGNPCIIDDIVEEEQDYCEAFDKIPSYLFFKLPGNNRFVPLSFVRFGACLGESNTLMYGAHVNIGAKIGDENLLDGSCSVASCAQIGNRNKIGSFVSIEGVLSPVNAKPVVIHNDNFFGTNCRIGTGLEIGNNNFWGSGVDCSVGTPLRDLREGSDTYGQYVKAGSPEGIQGQDETMIIVNRSVRDISEGVTVYPGEYLLTVNTEENQARFERNDDLTSNN